MRTGNRCAKVFLGGLAIGFLALGLLAGCSTSYTPGKFTATGTWNCANTVSCQEVYDMNLRSNQTVTFTVNNVTGGSVAQIALYGPGVALGGTNLFNGTTNETLCNYSGGSCANYTAGQTQTIKISPAGTYRFAITRNWGDSCGATGTFNLEVDVQKGPVAATQTVTDQATQASGTSCP